MTMQELKLPMRRDPPSIDLGRQILQVDALGSFLAGLGPHHRQPDLPGPDLAEELIHGQVREPVGSHRR